MASSRGAGRSSTAARRARSVAELAERHRLAVDPDAAVGGLSVGVRQRVEILKALYRDARVLILDEPTAVLTPPERDALFGVLRRLAAEGRTVLFVTHKLHEATAITDRVTILRDGRTVASLRTADTSPREIVRAMTGRNVNLKVEKGPARARRAASRRRRSHGRGARAAGRAVDRVSLTVRGGEIVGIAGVAGNGQSELVEALVGLAAPGRRARRGLRRRRERSADVEAHRAAGVAYVPEDRAAVGSALGGQRRRQSGDGLPPHGPARARPLRRSAAHSPSGRARSSAASPSASRTSGSTSERCRAATCRRSSSRANCRTRRRC